MSFDDFFRTATGSIPYDYQRRLACGAPTDGPRRNGYEAAQNANRG